MPATEQINARTVKALSASLLVCLGFWLAWCAFQVTVDSEDGYATLVNAAFFLGKGNHYLMYRPPLMSAFLMPAELIKSALHMQPMDMRVAHAFMAMLNLAYLIGVWKILIRIYGQDLPLLTAYAAAILTPVFFSYAPVLNFDIFPGLLALWMVRLAALQLWTPSIRVWSALVIIGTTLALIKQTFALIWVAVVVVSPMILVMHGAAGEQWRNARQLLLGAILSGVLTWIGYGIALAPAMSAEPLWLRPWLQMTLITSNYASEGGAWAAFYAWVYAKNLWAYGMLAVALVIPGLIIALARGSLFERMVALVWIFLLLAFHLTPYKEVRYLLILAPFTAVLLVPALRFIWQRQMIYRWLVLLILIAGLSLSWLEAVRIKDPFYSQGMTDFFEPLPKSGEFAGRLIFGKPLSFVSPESNAFFGDRYHRIMHMTLSPIVAFYGYSAGQYLQVDDVREVTADLVRPGDIAVLANGALARVAPFVRGNRERLAQDFLQVLGLAEVITLVRDSGTYRIAGASDSSRYMLVATLPDTLPSMVTEHMDESEAARLFGWATMPESAEVIAFRILRRCNLIGCARTDQAPVDNTPPAA